MRWLFLLLLWPSSVFTGEIPPTIAATVWVRSGDRSVGTGWVVNVERRWVLTARHVVADREQVEAYFVDPSPEGWKTLRNDYLAQQRDLRARDRIVAGKVIAQRLSADLALIELERLPAGIPALPLANKVELGESVHLIGHRHDAETLWTQTSGVVRQVGLFRDGYFWNAQKLGVDVPVVLLQMPVEAGDSGAAIVNKEGAVVGLLSAFSLRALGVSIAIQVPEIQALLAQAAKVNVRSPPTVHMNAHARRLAAATAWIKPQATDSRCAGAVIDTERRLLLTSYSAVGQEDRVSVVFPLWHADRLLAENEHYRDLLGRRLDRSHVTGFVLARDRQRDLALVQVEHLPPTMTALTLSSNDIKQGESVHTMNHPLGLELLWVYAAGHVRATAALALQVDSKEGDSKPQVSLVQLPHQGSSSGGALVNDHGALVGIMAQRDNPRQDVGYAIAVREIREFLQHAAPRADPKTPQDYLALAAYWSHHDRPREAVLACREAARLAPTDALIQLQTALALVRNQQPDAARAIAVKVQPITAATQALLGQVWLELGESKLAGPLFDTALKNDPKCIGAFLGRATLRTGAAALDDINEALFLDPNNVQAFAVRATKHDPNNRDATDKILADISRALELRPDDRALRTARVVIYRERKEWKKAIADGQHLVAQDEFAGNAWLDLANTHLLAGDEKAASQALVALWRVQPNQRGIVTKRIQQHGHTLLASGGDEERVCSWYELSLRALQGWVATELRGRIRESLDKPIGQLSEQRKKLEALLTMLK